MADAKRADAVITRGHLLRVMQLPNLIQPGYLSGRGAVDHDPRGAKNVKLGAYNLQVNGVKERNQGIIKQGG